MRLAALTLAVLLLITPVAEARTLSKDDAHQGAEDLAGAWAFALGGADELDFIWVDYRVGKCKRVSKRRVVCNVLIWGAHVDHPDGSPNREYCKIRVALFYKDDKTQRISVDGEKAARTTNCRMT